MEGLPNLAEVIRLVFEKLPIENFKGLNLPKKLPNLKSIQIRDCPLKSLDGLPSEMPNLKSISIGNLPKIQKINEFPKIIPEFNITVYNLQELHSLGALTPQTPIHNRIQTLNGFPKILPEIDSLFLTNLPELRSLEGLPSQTPKLKSIRLQDLPKFHTFEGLNSELPKLSRISLYDLPKLHTFKGLPKKLPQFSDLTIQDVDLHTFKHLPLEVSPHHFGFSIFNYKRKSEDYIILDLPIKTPFSGFAVQDCIVKDFSFMSHYSINDLKKTGLTLERCIIRSFEGFPPLPENINNSDLKEIFDRHNDEYNDEEPFLVIGMGCKIRSLSGLPLPFLKYFFPEILFREYFDFAPYGKLLIDKIVDWRYLKRTRWETVENGLHLEFLSELYEYFKNPVLELAHKSIADPSSIPVHQMERLIHEADHDIRKLLENSLLPKNPILLKISQKLSFETANGLKILK